MNELLVVRGDRYQSGMHTEIGIRENSGSKSFHCAGNSESSPNFKPSPGSELVQVSQGGHYAAPVAQAKCLELFALSWPHFSCLYSFLRGPDSKVMTVMPHQQSNLFLKGEWRKQPVCNMSGHSTGRGGMAESVLHAASHIEHGVMLHVHFACYCILFAICWTAPRFKFFSLSFGLKMPILVVGHLLIHHVENCVSLCISQIIVIVHMETPPRWSMQGCQLYSFSNKDGTLQCAFECWGRINVKRMDLINTPISSSQAAQLLGFAQSRGFFVSNKYPNLLFCHSLLFGPWEPAETGRVASSFCKKSTADLVPHCLRFGSGWCGKQTTLYSFFLTWENKLHNFHNFVHHPGILNVLHYCITCVVFLHNEGFEKVCIVVHFFLHVLTTQVFSGRLNRKLLLPKSPDTINLQSSLFWANVACSVVAQWIRSACNWAIDRDIVSSCVWFVPFWGGTFWLCFCAFGRKKREWLLKMCVFFA